MNLSDIDLLDIALFSGRREQAAFRLLRDEAPVHFNPEPSGPGFYALTRYEHVSQVVRDTRRFSSAQGTQIIDRRAEGHGHPSVHNSDPPLHTQLRNVAMAGLRKKVADDMEDRIRLVVRSLFDAAPTGEPFDFVEQVALPLPMIVIADLLGVPAQDQRRMVVWANTMSDSHASVEAQAAARHELFGYFRALVRQKRAEPADDVATLLATARLDGEWLTDEQLDAYFMVLTVAGNETTRFLVSGGLEQLCRQPEEFARLRANQQLIPVAVEEMVRWVTPVMHMRRTATEDCEIGGVPIRRGDKVVPYFASANRDERQFADGDQFRIDRQPNPHLGFGQGAHFCMGAHIARAEARIFFEEYFARYKQCELKELGERLPSYWFGGLTRLVVEWQAH